MAIQSEKGSFAAALRGLRREIFVALMRAPTLEDIRTITRASPLGALITTLNVVIYFVYARQGPQAEALTIWCGCSIAVTLVLFRRSRAAQGVTVTRVSPRALRRVLLFTILMASPWLALPLIALNSPSEPDRNLALLVQTGMVAGGALMLHRIMAATAVYCGSILTITCLAILMAYGLDGWPMMVYAALFGAMLLLSANVASRISRERDQTMVALESANNQIRRLAMEDGLTGLLNRTALLDALEERTAAQQGLAVFALDLDRFKNVNDSLGHPTGDALLTVIARRLKAEVRAEDIVARLGGDEFAVVMANMSDPEEIGAWAHRLLQTINAPAEAAGHVLYPESSIGGAIFPKDADNGRGVLAAADIALNAAKTRGRGRFVAFTPTLGATVAEEEQTAAKLREALQAGALDVFYQPKVALSDGRVVGAEALARWRDESIAASPERFLEIAAERGLMPDLADYVFATVARDVGDWQVRGGASVTVALNIHAVDLKSSQRLLDRVERLADTGLKKSDFLLEITEGCIVGRGADAASILIDTLSDMGFKLSLDDFGTGHAALAHLKRLPVSEVKIDRSFVAGVETSRHDRAIIAAITALGRGLNLNVVAEGVETDAQRAKLLEMGVETGQGYLWSEALPADAFFELCQSRSALSGGMP